MNPIPPSHASITASRPAPRRAGGLVDVVILLALAALAGAGCGPSPAPRPLVPSPGDSEGAAELTPGPPAATSTVSAPASAAASGSRAADRSVLAGLVVLLEGQGDRSLILYDSAGASNALTGVPGHVDWASLDRRGRLLITLTDGTLAVSQPIGAASTDVGFATVVVRPASAMPPEPLLAASLSPDGSAIAALGGPLLSGTRFDLVAIDLPSGVARRIPIDGQPEGVAPVWVGLDRVAVWRRDRTDRLGLALVRPSDGRVQEGAPGPLLAAVDEKSATVATLSRDPEAAWVGPMADWASGTQRAPQVRPPDPTALIAHVALGPGGDRLAVVMRTATGTRLEVRARAGGAWPVLAVVSGPGDGPGALVAPLGWLTRQAGRPPE